jgi:predicted nucleic acid-binding protein
VPWVIDTCLLIDIADADPNYSAMSGKIITGYHSQGLIVSPISYIELAPAFKGVMAAQNHFLAKLGVDWTERWTWADTQHAFAAWSEHMAGRRDRQSACRPIADILIGAFALRFRGLLTRNVRDFRRLFPNLRIEACK